MYRPNETPAQTAGSLTPQLEGAPHTDAHTGRAAPAPSAPQGEDRHA